jgi:hypothetical protein
LPEITTSVANGADLQSKVASNGTVHLYVDHENESYYADFLETFTWADSKEILAYLREHGFELMDEDECPIERLPHGGFRAWACHSEGLTFE